MLGKVWTRRRGWSPTWPPSVSLHLLISCDRCISPTWSPMSPLVLRSPLQRNSRRHALTPSDDSTPLPSLAWGGGSICDLLVPRRCYGRPRWFPMQYNHKYKLAAIAAEPSKSVWLVVSATPSSTLRCIAAVVSTDKTFTDANCPQECKTSKCSNIPCLEANSRRRLANFGFTKRTC
jgi:hypothetical protein